MTVDPLAIGGNLISSQPVKSLAHIDHPAALRIGFNPDGLDGLHQPVRLHHLRRRQNLRRIEDSGRLPAGIVQVCLVPARKLQLGVVTLSAVISEGVPRPSGVIGLSRSFHVSSVTT